jgi:hypothetical protein
MTLIFPENAFQSELLMFAAKVEMQPLRDLSVAIVNKM